MACYLLAASRARGGDFALRKWLGRLGYAAAAIILLAVLAALLDASPDWLRQFRGHAEVRSQTRTHPRPLVAQASTLEAIAVRSLLPYPVQPVREGLRYINMPSFYDWYSLTLELAPSGNAWGLAAVVHQSPGASPTQPKLTFDVIEHFQVPASSVQTLIQRLDQIDNSWRGDSSLCEDGTPIAFERVQKGTIRSGVGNAGCSAHFHAIQTAVFQTVMPFAVTARLIRKGR